MWEIRADGIAGCLRTARGGSSKQALVEAGAGELRVRWMTAREYARAAGRAGLRAARAAQPGVAADQRGVVQAAGGGGGALAGRPQVLVADPGAGGLDGGEVDGHGDSVRPSW